MKLINLYSYKLIGYAQHLTGTVIVQYCIIFCKLVIDYINYFAFNVNRAYLLFVFFNKNNHIVNFTINS